MLCVNGWRETKSSSTTQKKGGNPSVGPNLFELSPIDVGMRTVYAKPNGVAVNST